MQTYTKQWKLFSNSRRLMGSVKVELVVSKNHMWLFSIPVPVNGLYLGIGFYRDNQWYGCLDQLPSQSLPSIYLCSPASEPQVHGFWRFKLKSLCLHNKPLTKRFISPARGCFPLIIILLLPKCQAHLRKHKWPDLKEGNAWQHSHQKAICRCVC